MTDEPWHCGELCPFRGCPECAYRGGDWPVDDGGRGSVGSGRIEVGNDERPTAPTVDRSSHSDSTEATGGRSNMLPTRSTEGDD